jgi:hypothetical protein
MQAMGVKKIQSFDSFPKTFNETFNEFFNNRIGGVRVAS